MAWSTIIHQPVAASPMKIEMASAAGRVNRRTISVTSSGGPCCPWRMNGLNTRPRWAKRALP
jgi:hypothetical protein